MTMNGGSSGYETPSTVTCASCMHSSSAACVFGDARFTSSTSSSCANTGPGRNSNSFSRWLKTLTPVTSDGRRSGVNWSRENEQSSERASAFASIVFPTPGKSSMIRCPSATRQRTTSRSVSAGAWTTRARLATIAATRSAGAGAAAGSAKKRLHLVEDGRGDLLLRRLRHCALAARGEERHLVVGRVEADPGTGHVVVDEQIGVLARALLPRALEARDRPGRRRSRRAAGPGGGSRRGRRARPSSARARRSRRRCPSDASP